MLRTRDLDGDRFPDGGGALHQPIQLLFAMNVVRGYLAEQEPKTT